MASNGIETMVQTRKSVENNPTRSEVVSNVKLETKNKNKNTSSQQVNSIAWRILIDSAAVFFLKKRKSKKERLSASSGSAIKENAAEKPLRLPMAM